MNKCQWSPTRVGLRREGSFDFMVPWHVLVRNKTTVKGVYNLKSDRHDINIFNIKKTIDGCRYDMCFNEEKEALMFIDLKLIKAGRKPKHILKKA